MKKFTKRFLSFTMAFTLSASLFTGLGYTPVRAAVGDKWELTKVAKDQELTGKYFITIGNDYYMYSSKYGKDIEMSSVDEISEEFQNGVLTESEQSPGSDALEFQKTEGGYKIFNPELKQYAAYQTDDNTLALVDSAEEATVFQVESQEDGTIILSTELEGKKAYLGMDVDSYWGETTYSMKDSSDQAAALSLYQVKEQEVKEAYVLMNIPYSQFYQQEVQGGVDAVTSATATKKRAYNLASGSFHTDENSAGIEGVVYPVKVADLEAFKEAAKKAGGQEVTDADSLSYSVKLRGKDTPVELKGKDVLFERPAYSYYLLSEKPDHYKELTIENGQLAFGKAQAQVTEKSLEGLKVLTTDPHVDYAVDMKEAVGDDLTDQDIVNAVVVTDANGKRYGLGHVSNIWRKTSIGWNHDGVYKDLVGGTIKNISIYTDKGILSYDTDLKVPGYVEEVSAKFDGSQKLRIENLPEDAKNVEVSVYLLNGRKKEGYLTTEGEKDNAVAVKDGVAELTAKAEPDKEYTVSITAENYKIPAVKATYSENDQKKESNTQTPEKKNDDTKQTPAVSDAKDGQVVTVKGNKYQLLSVVSGQASLVKAKNAKKVSVPATFTYKGKQFNVTTVNSKAFKAKKIRTVVIGKNVSKISAKAFAKSKVKTVIVKTKKLKKKTVKKCLKGSKVKLIKVKVGSKKLNRRYVKKYKKIFTKKNAGRKVIVR